MLCEPLVGRTGELEALRHRVDGLALGRGGVVALAGDAGAGKSRLLGEAAVFARSTGRSVLSGRAVPNAGSVAYRPLAEAFLAAFRSTPPPDDPALIGFRGHLARLVPAWSDEGGSIADDSPVLVAEATARLLAAVAADTNGAVLLLEDLHWADPETLAAVDYLVDALASMPVLCVVTARPEGAAADILDRLVRRDPGAVLHLAPLAGAQLDEMVAACLGTSAAPSTLARFVRAHSDGIPFLVEELLAGLVASGELRDVEGRWELAPSLTPAVPASLQSSIDRRVTALGPEARRVVGAAALLGRHFEWELLPGIAQVDGHTAVEALRAAVAEQLIEPDGDGFTFRHALTREAVVGQLLPPERRELAVHALEAVELANPGLPGSTCELAADLALAAGDQRHAADLLVESARRALDAGALVTAEATARRAALSARVDARTALDADELLVDALVAAGHAGEALDLGRDLFERLVAAGEPAGRQLDVLVTTARAAVAAGDVARAGADIAAARQILGAATGADDLGRRAAIDAVGAHVALDGGDLDGARDAAERARAAAATAGHPELQCDALLVLGRLERAGAGARGTSRFTEAVELAEAHGLRSWHLRAQTEIAISRFAVGDLDGLVAARDLAERYGALATVAVMDLSLADVALSAFDRDGCLAAATACVEAGARYRLATLPVAHLWLAGAHALRGDDAAMQTSVATALADDPDDPRILGDLYGRVLPTRALVADRFEDLPALLDTSMEHVRRAPPTTSVYPGRVLWALLHAAADGDLGAGPRAELAAHVDATGMALFELGLELVDAVILGRRGDRESASATFDAARTAALSRQMHHGMTHAHAVIVSEAALRDGWGDPVPALRSAEAFFVDGGYDALARRCRRMLAQAGAAPPRRGRGDSEVPASLRALGVTSREVDVLKRVAAGRTNKQIASDLVLSPKTVERHISSLFDRTGVRSRTALIAVAAEHLGADVGDGIR